MFPKKGSDISPIVMNNSGYFFPETFGDYQADKNDQDHYGGTEIGLFHEKNEGKESDEEKNAHK